MKNLEQVLNQVDMALTSGQEIAAAFLALMNHVDAQHGGLCAHCVDVIREHFPERK